MTALFNVIKHPFTTRLEQVHVARITKPKRFFKMQGWRTAIASIWIRLNGSHFGINCITLEAHFASVISSEKILDHEIMASFDVESLFTNVPIEGAVQAELRKLESDPTLADRTTLTPAQIANLLDFVLRSTYFQYNGSIYEQREGTAMGSPVSAVIANLHMETFEEQAIESAPSKPKIWKRYVDDTFTILDRDRVDSFLQHLNSQQPTIRFTMETENDNKIAFLDASVSREPDGRLTTSVYRKPTHTDQYLAYDSHHPHSVKRGIVKCLYAQAKRLVTTPSVISAEKKHLSSVLVSNGYPSSFVQKISKARTAPKKEPVAEFKSTAVLPYVQGISEPLRRCLEQQGIRTVFKSETTLRSHLVRPKDTVDPAKQDGVICRIPCECGKVYIGETGRSTHGRIKEHGRDIRLSRTQTSAVSEHAHKTGHYPLWNEVKFIDRDPHWYTRRVKEAIHIRLHPDNINRDSGTWNSRSVDAHDQETQQENGTTTDHWGNNFSPEQWGTKCTNQSPLAWYKWHRVTSRPHRLKKTSSKQSKRRDLQLATLWLQVTTSWDKR